MMTSHGHGGTPHESPWVVTVPLIMLAIPSVVAGYLLDPMVVGEFFQNAIFVNDDAHGFDAVRKGWLSAHAAIEEISAGYHGVLGFILHGLMAPPFWLAMAGLASAWFIYMKDDAIARWAYDKFRWLHTLLDRKYYMDDFNQKVFAKGSVGLGNGLLAFGERLVIDGLIVNGTAKVVGWFSGVAPSGSDRLSVSLCLLDGGGHFVDAYLVPVLLGPLVLPGNAHA